MREHLKDCRRIVVKVGTSTITYPNGRLNLKRVEELAWVLTDLRNRGKDVILVSSGAIGVGAVRMAMKTRPTAVREKQAAAAVGQAMLMQIYHNFFDRYNQTVAQVLLTKEELSSDSRYENTKIHWKPFWKWALFLSSMQTIPFPPTKLKFPIMTAFLPW